MSTFTLAISFDHFQFALIHGLNIPGSCAILFFTASDLTSITSHIHSWVLFLLWLHTFNLGSSSFSILSFCLFILFIGSQGKNTAVVCHSPLQWTTFCQTSPPWPVRLGWSHTAWLSFTEIDKAVVHVIRLTSFPWLWFQCVCPQMLLATPTVLLWFLLAWMWGISSWLLQQSAASAPYLAWGVSPHCRPSWPWMWSSSSRPSCTLAATAPWTWVCSRLFKVYKWYFYTLDIQSSLLTHLSYGYYDFLCIVRTLEIYSLS